MSVYFCLERNVNVSRTQLFSALGRDCFSVADDCDLSIDEADYISCCLDNYYIWIDLFEDQVKGFETFGLNVSTDISNDIGNALGVRLVSEHDNDFHSHTFPVDVKTATPAYEKDGWQFFECDDQLYPYYKPDNLYCDWLPFKKQEFDLNAAIEVCKAEQ